MNDKNHMIISINAEKSVDKIQHPLITKISQRSGYRKMYLNYNQELFFKEITKIEKSLARFIKKKRKNSNK